MSASLGFLVPLSPSEVDPREATATSTIAAEHAERGQEGVAGAGANLHAG